MHDFVTEQLSARSHHLGSDSAEQTIMYRFRHIKRYAEDIFKDISINFTELIQLREVL